MFKYEKNRVKKYHLSSLTIAKTVFFLFFLYMSWYKEIWGDVRLFLYGSVILLTFSVLFPFGDKKQKVIDFDCMTFFYKVLLTFGTYCFLTGIIVSVDRSSFLSSMITFFSYLVVLFDCCLISKRDGGWKWLMNIFCGVAFVCLVYVVFWGKPMLNGGATVYTLSSLNNPHTLALVFLMGIFGLVGTNQSQFWNTAIKMPLIVLLLYGILLTGSRKTLISVVIFLGLWMYSFFRKITTISSYIGRIVVLLGLLFFVVVIVWYFRRYYVGSDQFNRLLRLFTNEEDSANSDRLQMYQVAWDLWKKNPVFGVGYNQFKYYSWRGDYSHSSYAEVLACTGLIGSGILFIPIFQYLINIVGFCFISSRDIKYYFLICLAGTLAELFLGVGQIWIYGISHELFYLCIFGVFDEWAGLVIENLKQTKERKKWKYLV